MDSDTLKWHLAILENASCVGKDKKQTKTVCRLTQEGSVVDYLNQGQNQMNSAMHNQLRCNEQAKNIKIPQRAFYWR